MSLVWMFKEHRNLNAELQTTKVQLELLSDRYLRSQEDAKNLTDAIEKLQQYIATQINTSTVDIFEKYQQQILQDRPYDDGKIPDTAWLTPGDAPREEPVKTDV